MKRISLSDIKKNQALKFDIYDDNFNLLLREGCIPNYNFLLDKHRNGVYLTERHFKRLEHRREVWLRNALADPKTKIFDLCKFFFESERN